MLLEINIRNFTIIDTLNIEFDQGLSVLTGETGAGKSIWVDAIDYALGARADNKLIRHGENRCEIGLSFDLTKQTQAMSWLIENNYDDNQECIIRRIISKDSNSKATINGRPCPLQLLRQLGALLLNIHGQHDNQALLKQNEQQVQLDRYAQNSELLDALETVYSQWRQATNSINELTTQQANREAELSLWRYQLDELITLNLQENEWQQLSEEHQQLHNAKELITQINEAVNLAADNEEISATQLVQEAIHQLNEIRFNDPQINNIKELLNTAAVHLQEAQQELHHYRDHLDLSPENLEAVETRLSKLHDCARKHHIHPENLLELQNSLSSKMQQLENIDNQLDALIKLKEQQEKRYETLANELTDRRKNAAKKLSIDITKSIQDLGIAGGQFQIKLENQASKLHPTGKEKIIFEVSTNPGHPFQPLSKIVSGGELSRISLALQVMTSQRYQTTTLIFDEVDTGIGGKTAETVGQLLRQLGENGQVLCVTHLAQVAAQGHHHYKITKTSQADKTFTDVKKLDKKMRVQELARMLSGSKISSETLAHAEQLLVSN